VQNLTRQLNDKKAKLSCTGDALAINVSTVPTSSQLNKHADPTASYATRRKFILADDRPPSWRTSSPDSAIKFPLTLSLCHSFYVDLSGLFAAGANNRDVDASLL